MTKLEDEPDNLLALSEHFMERAEQAAVAGSAEVGCTFLLTAAVYRVGSSVMAALLGQEKEAAHE